MYFSRVIFNSCEALRRVLKYQKGRDAYLLHQLLWDLFPNDGDKKRDFLFRKDEHGQLPRFFMVSQDRPVANGAFSVQTKQYAPQISAGTQLGFSLIANPTVSRSRKNQGKKNSADHDVWMDAKRLAKENGLTELETIKKCEEAMVEWLRTKGTQSGFELQNTTVDGYIQHRVFQKRTSRPIQFSSIDFNGVLAVTDPEQFTEMLFRGIGKSRALGCGLMLVRRL